MAWRAETRLAAPSVDAEPAAARCPAAASSRRAARCPARCPAVAWFRPVAPAAFPPPWPRHAGRLPLRARPAASIPRHRRCWPGRTSMLPQRRQAPARVREHLSYRVVGRRESADVRVRGRHGTGRSAVEGRADRVAPPPRAARRARLASCNRGTPPIGPIRRRGCRTHSADIGRYGAWLSLKGAMAWLATRMRSHPPALCSGLSTLLPTRARC